MNRTICLSNFKRDRWIVVFYIADDSTGLLEHEYHYYPWRWLATLLAKNKCIKDGHTLVYQEIKENI